VTVTMLIGLALIESLCIYALVVALILIFANPQAAKIAELIHP
jgi:F-type H+-transporting ATPase subunit c